MDLLYDNFSIRIILPYAFHSFFYICHNEVTTLICIHDVCAVILVSGHLPATKVVENNDLFHAFHSPLPKILTSKDSSLFIEQSSDAIPVRAIQLFAIFAICIIALLLCKEFLCGFQVTKIMTLIPCVGIRVKMPRHNVGLIVILLVKQRRISIAYFKNIKIFFVRYSSPFAFVIRIL